MILNKSITLSLIVFLFFFGTSCLNENKTLDVNSQPKKNKIEKYVQQTEHNDPVSTEKYNTIEENNFIATAEQPVSTFSIDADGASYSNVRRFLRSDQQAPKDAIRIEEIINYFDYNYPDPKDNHNIALNGEISECPWNTDHQLIRIGIKGKTIPESQRPAANIVLLMDVSGSMQGPDRLELLKTGVTQLVDKFRNEDRIAIVTYAGDSGLLLPSTPGDRKNKIKEAISTLGSGGSTAGAKGIITAYDEARKNLIEGGNNRVILCTDGDFNVGTRSQSELVRLIEEKRDMGIFLTVIGVGRGNLNDGMMEQLADNGNGTYEYIDNHLQAEKVFEIDFNKYYTIAKDVKIQIEFDPNIVQSYRLIGYENRLLNQEDFNDDTTDAGEIGTGQSITALYEIVPAGNASKSEANALVMDFRYKKPDAQTSVPMNLTIPYQSVAFEEASESMQFVAAVAEFGMILRDSPHRGQATIEDVKTWARNATQKDTDTFKRDFVQLLDKVK